MDRRLVELAMHGDEEAFGLLVGRLGDSLYSVARRILRDTALAQDATQQALMARGGTCRSSGIPTDSRHGSTGWS